MVTFVIEADPLLWDFTTICILDNRKILSLPNALTQRNNKALSHRLTKSSALKRAFTKYSYYTVYYYMVHKRYPGSFIFHACKTKKI